ncbi:MAG: hypothetical protein PHE49_04160 [bacterium]|nr:hypothetical protein [bacterium]
MKRIGILILLLPVYVFADVGFHPQTTNNLLNFSLLQTADTRDNNIEEKSSLYKYSYEAMNGFFGEVLGGLIGAGVAIIGLSMLGGAQGCSGEDMTTSVGFLLGAPPGAFLGLIKGVVIAGKDIGEEGSYWKTFLGTLVGTGVGLVAGGYASYLIDENGSGVAATVVGVGVGSLFSIAGAVWGYHW